LFIQGVGGVGGGAGRRTPKVQVTRKPTRCSTHFIHCSLPLYHLLTLHILAITTFFFLKKDGSAVEAF
jgi:hypothetical protein